MLHLIGIGLRLPMASDASRFGALWIERGGFLRGCSPGSISVAISVLSGLDSPSAFAGFIGRDAAFRRCGPLGAHFGPTGAILAGVFSSGSIAIGDDCVSMGASVTAAAFNPAILGERREYRGIAVGCR